MVTRIRKPRDLFTASQIARFCQVDLKTIHNWADRGQIPHFRTPGRHLRFRRPHVLHFLRKYGYPIPEELDAGRPRVALLTNGRNGGDEVAAALESSFEVVRYASPVAALLALGEQPPDAIVLSADLDRLRPADVVEALREHEPTQHVRAILLGDDADRNEALRAGASAHVGNTDLDGLRDTLEALMGVRH